MTNNFDKYIFDEDKFRKVYIWVDSFQLSKTKKSITRDFSDGILIAEIISQSTTNIINLNCMESVTEKKRKENNWEYLKIKVFNILGFNVLKEQINDIINCIPNSIEYLLYDLHLTLLNYKNNKIKNQLNDKIITKSKKNNYIFKKYKLNINVLKNDLKKFLSENNELENKIKFLLKEILFLDLRIEMFESKIILNSNQLI